jgi:MFS family permease
MMGLVSLFTDFSSEMIYPLLPVFIAGLVRAARPGAGADEILAVAAVYVGTMGGLAETTASLLKIVSGRISDALGRRKALVAVGYGISTVARPAMALAGAAWQVVALRVADRVGKGVRTSPRDALISDAVDPAVHGLAFSFHRVMDHAGAILGPLVGIAVLYAFLGQVLWKGTAQVAGADEMAALRWLFAIALIPGLLAMATIFGKVREIAPKPAKRESGRGRLAGWRQLPGRFYAYVGVVALFSLGNSSDLFLLLYGQKLFGYGLGTVIALWILLHVSKIIFSFPGGMLSDKLGRRPMIVAGWSIYALVYVGMAWLGGGWLGVEAAPWAFWALIAAYGAYYGMTEGVEKALVADFTPSEHRGTAYGIYHGAEGLAKLPASLMFGVFWLVIGPQVAFGIGAGLAAAAVISLAVLLSATRR